ncbi:White-opaque regulator 1 [Lasiodiplodia theobromae]|uniref:White-opaque regulator 1 n=1 Tax=Lasiodiplodia theobromae TaxID=45133 RepID=A0A5N5CTA4_9PEZI|nr:White-opaque regulator 1 [Lasiodiplodia theobromae]
MPASYRVRFAPSTGLYILPASPVHPQTRARGGGRSNSRTGCRECKLRRVKCDERYPVCLRCERRGSVCLPSCRPATWLTETPWLDVFNRGVVHAPPNMLLPPDANKRLLQHWLEKSSHMMVLDPNRNPFSYPILQHLAGAPSLLHALQSISAGYDEFYNPESLQTCLEERGRALGLVHDEIRSQSSPLTVLFLTVFLLGLSSSWIEEYPFKFGKEHFLGARTVIDLIIADENRKEDPLYGLAIGSYMYWDMACSYFFSSAEVQPLNTPSVFASIQETSDTFHPIAGFSVELFYLLGSLGRYCRSVHDTSERDVILEQTFEEQLQSWDPAKDDEHLALLSDSYRCHGLIMLYRVCGRPESRSFGGHGDLEDEVLFHLETDSMIGELARHIIDNLSQTPISSSYFNLHSIPLFTAGSELPYEHAELRQEVRNRFKALYSTNRCPVNLLAVELLTELWEMRDSGIVVSFLEFLLQKNVCLSFA